MTKGQYNIRGDDDYYFAHPFMVSALATASSDSKPEIPFGLGWEEAVETVAGYTKLMFAGFTQVYL